MDVPVDVFSQQPNVVRKLFIFPILQSTRSMHEARNLLCSLALVSKKSHAQINCPFFIRDAISLLGEKYADSDQVIAYQLNMPGAMKHSRICDRLYALTTDRSLPYPVDRRISYLLYTGAWLDARYGIQRTSILMHVINNAHVDFVDFLIKKGADVNARDLCGKSVLMHAVIGQAPVNCLGLLIAKGADPSVRASDGSCVRGCNIIYHQKKLKRLISKIVKKMWNVENNNRNDPHNYQSPTKYLTRLPEVKQLKNALAVDALLEMVDAKWVIQDAWCPLFKLLKKNPILFRLFLYIYSHEYESGTDRFMLPKRIQDYLENPEGES